MTEKFKPGDRMAMLVEDTFGTVVRRDITGIVSYKRNHRQESVHPPYNYVKTNSVQTGLLVLEFVEYLTYGLEERRLWKVVEEKA